MILDDEYLRIATIVGAHGLDGRLKIYIISDILSRFEEGNTVLIREQSGFKKYKIIEFLNYKEKFSLLRLEGINNRETAFLQKGNEIFIEKKEAERTRNISLNEDNYYYYDIIGCSVYLNNDIFGEVIDILEAGAGEVLIVSNNKGMKFMIPFVESMVDTKNIYKKRLDIYPIEGLFDF